MASRFSIVGIGEALFDIFPDKQVLGGAPLNVAVHAHQLTAQRGGEGVVVSRVGQDELGQEVVKQLASRGVNTSYLQFDPDRDTGRVYVGLDNQGQPEYEIVREVAWDWLNFDPDTEDLAQKCDAVCFGTLAQRNGQARHAIYRFLDTARRAVRLFDVNLRQNFYDRQILHRSCEAATVVKLNTDELPVVARELGLVGAEGSDHTIGLLFKRYPMLKLVALTRGKLGTVLYTPSGQRLEGEKVSYQPANDADAVGAGDACSAGLLVGMILRWPLERTLALANHVGAYVASQSGATPKLPESILEMVKR